MNTPLKITDEKQLLDEETRARIIKDVIDSDYNNRRKDEAFKGYECLKDKTVHYVVELLRKQFDYDTVYEMQYALSNISILRKVIDKLAKVYSNGVKRSMPKPEPKPQDPNAAPVSQTTGDPTQPLDPNAPKPGMPGGPPLPKLPDPDETDPATDAIEKVADYLDLNAAMKKANRYYRTFKNTLVYVKPVLCDDDKFEIKVDALPPFHYDAVENHNNPEKAVAIIISDYVPRRKGLFTIGDAATANRGKIREVNDRGDVLVQSYTPTGITGPADGSADDRRQFIWWTDSFHFTTNSKGTIIPQGNDDDGSNPIGQMPFVDISAEKDDHYFAEGGSDLIDTGVSINIGLTNIKHIGVSQGFGQLYMTGKDLPKSVKVGPNHCIQLQQVESDDPVPTIGYLASNPPLGELKDILEMEVALMLTTNNLSVSTVALGINKGKDFASGIALLIDRSESVEDIGEQAQVFIKKEPLVWKVIQAWVDAYQAAGQLTEEASQNLKLPKNAETVQLKFPDAQPVMAEMDRLLLIEKRAELALNTRAELMMRDDPSLTQAEAEDKIKVIDAEKAQRMNMLAFDAAATGVQPAQPGTGGAPSDGNQSQKDNGNVGSNDGNPGTNQGSQANGFGKKPNQ